MSRINNFKKKEGRELGKVDLTKSKEAETGQANKINMPREMVDLF